jgi:hypothetical protein
VNALGCFPPSQKLKEAIQCICVDAFSESEVGYSSKETGHEAIQQEAAFYCAGTDSADLSSKADP